jgi:hypothetical protein
MTRPPTPLIEVTFSVVGKQPGLGLARPRGVSTERSGAAYFPTYSISDEAALWALAKPGGPTAH